MIDVVKAMIRAALGFIATIFVVVMLWAMFKDLCAETEPTPRYCQFCGKESKDAYWFKRGWSCWKCWRRLDLSTWSDKKCYQAAKIIFEELACDVDRLDLGEKCKIAQ